MSWNRITGFPNYGINMSGEIYSFTTRKKLKPWEQRNGYLIVRLFKGGKSFSKYVHRLVGEVFLDNPDNLPEINHKDGNRQNNNVENLEWTSRSDNMLHKIYVSKKNWWLLSIKEREMRRNWGNIPKRSSSCKSYWCQLYWNIKGLKNWM